MRRIDRDQLFELLKGISILPTFNVAACQAKPRGVIGSSSQFCGAGEIGKSSVGIVLKLKRRQEIDPAARAGIGRPG